MWPRPRLRRPESKISVTATVATPRAIAAMNISDGTQHRYGAGTRFSGSSCPRLRFAPVRRQRTLYAFLAEKERRSGSLRTVQSYSRMLGDFFGSTGKTPDEVTSQDVFTWALADEHRQEPRNYGPRGVALSQYTNRPRHHERNPLHEFRWS